MSTQHRPMYLNKEDYLVLVSKVYQAWCERDSHNGDWHIEDISIYMEMAIESVKDVVTALDDMGFRYANNGNG